MCVRRAPNSDVKIVKAFGVEDYLVRHPFTG